ncbi:MAG: cation:proton antiporter [Planctomycetes bacterium]|nr:cation:proton antiporter [Planctomycetota bacterium]
MDFLASSDLSQFRFLIDIGIVLGAGVVASLAMAALRLPAVTGLLLAGAICGPFGPFGHTLIEDPHTINLLAEIGVVLLLFTIGLEFPLSRFLRIGKPLIIGGSLQVGLTVAAATGVTMAFGWDFRAALPIAFAVSLSSTAIVLRGMADRGEIDAPHGRFIVGTLLFQDLCVIPMMLTLPVLAGGGSAMDLLKQTGVSLGLAAAAVVVTYLLSRAVLPFLLARVDKTRSRESFVLAILAICIGIALSTGYAGLSLALGAFLAGVVIADSPFATRALTDVMPLRDVLTGLFFISLGMLFDYTVLLDNPLLVVGIFLLIFFGKSFLATIAALFMRFPARAAVIAGLGLAQMGEFGFVVLNAASGDSGLVDMNGEVRFLSAAAILTMFITPLVIRFSPHLAAGARLLRPLERLLGVRAIDEPTKAHEEISNHVVIAGYGVGGRMVASALKTVNVPYIILEMNAETVRAARKEKEPAYYADVTSQEALEHARIHAAKAFVLTINDPAAAHRALDTLKRCAPEVPIIVRSRYHAEGLAMLARGATDVVSGELEAAVEIMARVLRLMNVPRNIIDRELAIVRERTQLSARRSTVPRNTLADLGKLGELKIESYQVNDSVFANGKTLADMHLRTKTGANVIAISRGGEVIEHPAPDMPMKTGDVVHLLGSLQHVRDAICYMDTGEVPSDDPVGDATRIWKKDSPPG